ncbi:TPA: hypothetical protein ACHTCR_001120 [Pseudomonas putida]|uniref:Uncharacterized protein n=1 Tax=Pseudomonas putida (strain GB-1) TaxID=76869 RepID=B0KGJ2_PSEPG|nr:MULTISPECIES: hypothetical protein [Pseudomonas]ABY98993.1 hypothetical protein PputGB1_3101 [Pseudomonas putida GB-1]APF01634.1 hypothetical protein BG030_14905 [Pseudomonas putida]MBP0708799.1 hypothetical protein [Pseudomonas sp. T34]MCE1001023.1 hypothetical protein [Pseudomonas sp. NMI1173_11]MCK2188237.1 hypothetical protein [Pseudomonas sp. MB04B]
MNSQVDVERAQDLERRLCAYEELERRAHWPGALTAADVVALALLVLVMIAGAYYLGGHP